MHNRALHDTLAAFVEEAAGRLAEEVSSGAEIPFDLVESGRAASPLYCYKPLTTHFIAERVGSLGRLPSYPAVQSQFAALDGLDQYLQARGRRAPSDPRARADTALVAFLGAIWGEATDFVLDPERFASAFAELEATTYAGCVLGSVVAPVEGLVLESDDVALGEGLRLTRAAALADAPADLRGDAYATVAVLTLEAAPGEEPSLEAAGRRLRRLQTALRLWDGAEPAVGPVAWARTDGGPWLLVPLAGGLRRPMEDCLLGADEEDPLRAFCSLVARRTPRSGALAWALRRFELGCERPSAFEALTDWLLAAHALLGERVPERMAAICAVPAERDALAARLHDAQELERRVVAGIVRPDAATGEAIAELGGHLRAILRDVLCGHLDADLRGVADSLLAASPAPAPPQLKPAG
jgi:hypothetical protein